jgi:hypothetical protein
VVLAASTLYLNRSAMKRSRSGSVSWDLPEWAAEYTTSEALKRVDRTDEEMMKVAVDLSRRNVEEVSWP